MTHTTTTTTTHRAVPDGMAIAGFVCGAAGIVLFWLYGILPVLAIVFSAVSMNSSKRTGQRPSGLSVAGLTLGIIELAVILLFIVAAIAVS